MSFEPLVSVDDRRHSPGVTVYRLLLVLKFLGVLGYAGGLVAAFVATAPAERKRAVHAIASPALLVTWVAGWLLADRLGVALTELWVLGGLVLSCVSLLALIRAARRPRSDRVAFATAAAPLVAVVVMMAFRPTWSR